MAKLRSTVVIEGADEIIAEIERRGGNARRVLADALTEGAEIIARTAQERVRPSSRRVADAITVQVGEKRRGSAVVKVGVQRKLAYIGRFIEHGTSPHQVQPRQSGGRKALKVADGRYYRRTQVEGAPPRPWLRPAFDEKRSDAEDHIRDRLRKAMDL